MLTRQIENRGVDHGVVEVLDPCSDVVAEVAHAMANGITDHQATGSSRPPCAVPAKDRAWSHLDEMFACDPHLWIAADAMRQASLTFDDTDRAQLLRQAMEHIGHELARTA